jgi:hypothetical protein
VVADGEQVGADALGFKTQAQLTEEEATLAALEFREPRAQQYGFVYFESSRTTEGGAPSYARFGLVLQHGETQLRSGTLLKMATQVQKRADGWDMVSYLFLVDPLPGWPLTVHLVDKGLLSRCTWTVAEDGTVSRVSPDG